MKDNNAAVKPSSNREVEMTSIAFETMMWYKGMSSKRYMINQGGTYAGKTMSILYGLYFLLTLEEQPIKIRVVGMTSGHLRDGAISDFLKILRCAGNVRYTYHSTYQAFKFYKTGKESDDDCSTIQFISLDKPSKALGGKFDLVFLNEANTMIYDTVKEVDSRSERGIIMDFNPTRPFWLHTEGYLAADFDTGETYIKRRDVAFYQWNYLQNLSNISASKAQQIQSWKETDEARYHVYGLGYLGKVEGLVHPKVTLIDESECPPIEEADFLDFGLDMGGTDPYALVLFARHGRNLYLREYLYQTDHVSHLTIDEVLLNLGLKEFCDAYSLKIHADTNNVMATKQLRKAGFAVVDARKGQGSVENGINILNGFNNIFITLQSPNFCRASKTYVYKKNLSTGTVKPENKDKHLWDAARYVALSFRFMRNYENSTIIQP